VPAPDQSHNPRKIRYLFRGGSTLLSPSPDSLLLSTVLDEGRHRAFGYHDGVSGPLDLRNPVKCAIVRAPHGMCQSKIASTQFRIQVGRFAFKFVSEITRDWQMTRFRAKSLANIKIRSVLSLEVADSHTRGRPWKGDAKARIRRNPGKPTGIPRYLRVPSGLSWTGKRLSRTGSRRLAEASPRAQQLVSRRSERNPLDLQVIAYW